MTSLNLRKCACLLVLLFALSGCKSELEECTEACDRVEKKLLAECTDGDKACADLSKQKGDFCKKVCKDAKGDKKAKDKGKNLEADCEKGDIKACGTLGKQYTLGAQGKPKDVKKAIGYLEKACAGKDGFCCWAAGKIYQDGKGGIAKDAAKGLAFLKIGCDLDNGTACRSYGLTLLKGKDKLGAAKALEKGCKFDDKLACVGIGGLTYYGRHVKEDKAKGIVYWKKACKLGSTSACKKLKEIGATK